MSIDSTEDIIKHVYMCTVIYSSDGYQLDQQVYLLHSKQNTVPIENYETMYLASARRALCPPDKLSPFSPTRAESPPTILEISKSKEHTRNTSEYLLMRNNRAFIRSCISHTHTQKIKNISQHTWEGSWDTSWQTLINGNKIGKMVLKLWKWKTFLPPWIIVPPK